MKKENQKNTDLQNKGDSNANTEQKDKHAKARRRIIVGGGIIGASGSIPEKWTSSLVESVVLPAHATTTEDNGAGPTPTPTPTKPPVGTPRPSPKPTPSGTPGPPVPAPTPRPSPAPTA